MILASHAALDSVVQWVKAVPWAQRCMLVGALAFGCVAAGTHPSEPPAPKSTGHSEATAETVKPAASRPAEDPALDAKSTELVAAEADDPDLDWPKRTPLTGEAAAHYLSEAWTALHHTAIERETLAVLWAHWALETGRGERMTGYNFAGIKGRAPRGGSHRLWTWEKNDSSSEWVQRTFRAYDNPEAGARDYLRLLKGKYPRAIRAARRGSPIDFVSALNEGGYFTEEPEAYLRAISSLTREFLQDPDSAGAFADRADPDSRI
jgi:flagellum-specific peptidoglycan hydrolase FlgJ